MWSVSFLGTEAERDATRPAVRAAGSDLLPGATNRSFRSAATIRWLISPTENPFRASADFETSWHKLRWRFASSEHRDLFTKDPQHYAPQYDGYCAMGTSNDAEAHKDTVDPEAWAIVDGKLYLVHNRYWLEKWREQATEYIKRADASWQVVADLPDPIIVGATLCRLPAARPRSHCAMADIGWSSAGRSRATRPGMSSARAICGRRSSRLARTSTRASRPAAQRSTTLSLRSTRSRRPPNSTNTPICSRAISAHLRRRARRSRAPQLSSPDLLLQVEAFAAIK